MGGATALMQVDSCTGKGIMKKRVVAGGLVLAAAAAWTGTAWYTGKRIEDRLAQDVQALDAQAQRLGKKLGIPVALELLYFERGVFSSTARFGLKVTVQSDGKPAEKAFEFTGKVEHGPFPASRLASGDIAPVMAAGGVQMAQTPDAAAWFAAAGGSAPVTANFLFAYDRDVSVDLALAPVKYADDPVTFEFSGLQARAERAGDGTRGSASLAVDKMSLSEVLKGGAANAGRQTLTLDGLAVSHQSSGASEAFTSSTTLKVRDWVSDLEKLPLGLKDVVLTLGSETAAERMTGKATLDVGSISVRGQHVAKLRMAAGGKDMDVASLKAFQDFSESAPLRVEKDEPILGDKMLAASHLLKFLLARPSFTLSTLEVESANGTSSLGLDIGLDSPSFWNRDPVGIVKEVVRNLSVRLKLSTDGVADLIAARLELKGATPEAARIAARQEADVMRDLIAQKRWGRIENGVIQVDADYRDGQLDFNGERMPVEAFFGRVLLR